MDRQEFIKQFSHIAPVKNIGQSYKGSTTPYLVLKKMTTGKPLGGRGFGEHQSYNFLCYVPDTSTVMLDNLVTAVKNRLLELESEGVEYEGIGEDYHDTDIKMYMRYVAFRVPQAIM